MQQGGAGVAACPTHYYNTIKIADINDKSANFKDKSANIEDSADLGAGQLVSDLKAPPLPVKKKCCESFYDKALSKGRGRCSAQ